MERTGRSDMHAETGPEEQKEEVLDHPSLATYADATLVRQRSMGCLELMEDLSSTGMENAEACFRGESSM
jgi:hypothetical protein